MIDRLKESRMFMELAYQEAMELYKQKEIKYKDSWRESSLEFLHDRLEKEVNELRAETTFIKNSSDKWDKPKVAKELLDIINVAAMFYERIMIEID